MEHKIFEIRDRATCMVMMGFVLRPNAISNTDKELRLLSRAGYGVKELMNHQYIALVTLDSDQIHGTCNIYEHPAGVRTRQVAHGYIEKHWRDLKSGDVIDVEFILGETKTKKQSEINFWDSLGVNNGNGV